MKADVRFTLPDDGTDDLTGVTAVVVDVIRATSTLTTALGRGARAVFPAASTEDALRLAQSLGREDTLLCGERKALPIEGYDLGNSPREYTREVVEGKRLIMNTTNGTRAILAMEDADRVYALSLLNLRAVAETVRGVDRLILQCAGREGTFALEDAVCSGLLLRTLWEYDVDIDAGDGARAAMELAGAFRPDEAFLRSTLGGQAVAAVGLGADLSWCARMDECPVVPVLRDRSLVLLDEEE